MRETRVLLVGLMAVGKSTVGAAVARATGWPEFDNDALLQEMTGQSAPDLLAQHGVERLRQAESGVLGRLLETAPPLVSGVAAGVVLDAGDRARLRAGGHVVWLRAPVETLVARVQGTSGRAWLDEDPRTVLQRMADERSPLYAEVAHQALDVDRLSPEEAARQVVAALSG
jgi:shikimate kinase